MKTTKKGNTFIIQIVLGLLIVLSNYQANATDYFVKVDGNDDADGLSDATAWASISKINSTNYSPGDQILFNRGDVWRNTALQVTSSGNSSSQITYGAYGTGNKPEILGSLGIISWTNVSGNIWASDELIPSNPRAISQGADIFFEGKDGAVTWGHYETYISSYSNITKEYDWTWNNSKIYIFCTEDPNLIYVETEAPQIRRILMTMDNEYVTIDNLYIRYAINTGIFDQYNTIYLSGLRVTNCDIGCIGIRNSDSAYGLSVHQSNAYYAHNEIHNCGRRGISLTIYETTPIILENIIIENNHFHSGFHTTGVDIIKAGPHTIKNITIRNNFMEDDPNYNTEGEDAANANQIFINDGNYAGTIGNIEIYNNIFAYPTASSIKIGSGVENISIFHNTFYGFNQTHGNYQAQIWTAELEGYLKIKNNVFYSNSNTSNLFCIRLSTAIKDICEIDYNLYYVENPAMRFIMIDNYPNSGNSSYTPSTWESYTTEQDFDANSPTPANPKFINPVSDFRLSTGSPAIGKAIEMLDITTDFFGNPMNNPADLGAIQGEFEAPEPDESKPSKPTGLIEKDLNFSRFGLTWNSATDNIGVVAYDIYKDGVYEVSVTETSATIIGLLPTTTYSITIVAKDEAGNESEASEVLYVTTLTPTSSDYLATIESEDFPEPFFSDSKIHYWIPEKLHVCINVYDLFGKHISNLVNGYLPEGNHTADWNTTDQSGQKLPSGVYIFQLVAGEFVKSQKMLLIE